MDDEFDKTRTGTGTAEWAEYKINISRGCINNCLYCYAAAMAKRFGWRDRNKWQVEELNKQAERKRFPELEGVVMFPTSHDITLFNLEACVRVAGLILAAGNKLLIVSKPRLSCIERLCHEFEKYKEQILFRFTIGTMHEEVSRSWEPGAPLPIERMASLTHAHNEGFRTSVSIEPILGGTFTAAEVVWRVRPFVTDTVWVGKMNQPRRRVDMSVPDNIRLVKEIESLQDDESIIHLFRTLEHIEQIRWKDSIREVLVKHGYLKVSQ
ncbi:MAG: hypothetical protein VR65_24970 [Desulfobulbaceae bacterium BRH_c16a]|nr:MAG: hypothetical protein VR65_24970 [Desulfobulbaceae bacterium BRH_c16a]